MSWRSKSSFKSTVVGAFVTSVTKWAGATLQNLWTDLTDSIQWIDQVNAITFGTTFNYDCSVSSLQSITLTANATFTVSNTVAGGYYTLLVYQDGVGGRTLTFPSGKTNGGTINIAAGGCTIVTFLYDGTYIYFSVASYA